MKFSFGICTDGSPEACQRICTISHSIMNEVPQDCYEIIVVGNPQSPIYGDNIRIVNFNENERPAWITRKKNLITHYAKYENIVYMHDYVLLQPEWYLGWLKYGNEFHVAMNKITTFEGTRFRDWVLWVDPPVVNALAAISAGTHDCMIPYNETQFVRHQYFSGAYWVAKKSVMQRFPLNEGLTWDQGEDVVWSKEVRETYGFQMNSYSGVKLLKPCKANPFVEISPDNLAKLKEVLK